MRKPTPIVSFFYSSIIILIILSSCSPSTSSQKSDLFSADQLVDLSFKVIPLAENSCPIQQLDIVLFDDLNGQSSNQTIIPLTKTADAFYKTTIQAELGSTLRYQYRIDGKLSELTPDYQPAFFHSFTVGGYDEIQDVISTWEGCKVETETGSIYGQVTLDGLPAQGLWIQAVGMSSTTHFDGSFYFSSAPIGQYHLQVSHPEGKTSPFQQLVRVDSGKVTKVNLHLRSNKMVDVTFIVTAPNRSDNEDLSIKLVSNHPDLGGFSFNTPSGIIHSSSPLPVLIHQDRNIYYYSTQLYSGTNFRYYYTLGDERWNTERDDRYKPLIRQIQIPVENITINDSINTFNDYPALSPILFRIKTPANTPSTDIVSIQLKQTNWTPPVEMNRISDFVWEYYLTSGYDLLNPLYYRFCRNGQCGLADEDTTAGFAAEGFSLDPKTKNRTVNHEISAWKWLPASDRKTKLTVSSSIHEKDRDNYWSGVEWTTCMDPSWRDFIPLAVDHSVALSSNWIILRPGFSIDPVPYQVVSDANQTYYLDQAKIRVDHYKDTKKPFIAIFPTPTLEQPIEDWLKNKKDSPDFWQQWSVLYQLSVLDFASYAALNGFDAIILGGEWIVPFLPSDPDPSLQNSISPLDADTYWVNLIQEIRKVFKGKIVFALPADVHYSDPPLFLDKTDAIYSILTHPEQFSQNLKDDLTKLLDTRVKILQETYHKPIVIGINFPSISRITPQTISTMEGPCHKPYGFEWTTLATSFPVDLQTQVNYYSILLYLINERDWIQGFISQGYYPVVDTLDFSSSIGGKPTSGIIQYWNQTIFPAQ